jgi:3-methylcrotonyl-CoA carboxylase alpha subunit
VSGIERLLIANRGEISVRIIRACRELGIASISVYSDADADAMHRRLADESYRIGPAPPAESYLNESRIIEVVEASNADAVHPGYGFLSESAAFARAVGEAGAVWVGPSPDAMDLMASKVGAKELAVRAGIPVLPGYAGDGDADRYAEAAEEIGYPVLVKASAGGGGRGMRVVEHPDGLTEALRGASREAAASFGDGSVFLERWLPDPRHVEVQVIGDRYGAMIHLFERECSIQRRHQKVVEESPCPALDPTLRATLCAAAMRLAESAGYTNAGTVEFLLAGDEFFFLEMNARLQVEHPVTELVTGLDLVHLQLLVAAGKPLPIQQEDVALSGSAAEVRLYAEDNGIPWGGRLLALEAPNGPGVRNDAGYEAGDTVPLHYDAMLAKLIVYAPTRATTVARLRRALYDYEVLGVPTNLPLLRRICDHPAFSAGETTVHFLERHRLSEPPAPQPVPETAILLAAAVELSAKGFADDPFAAGPWRHLGAISLHYGTDDGQATVEVRREKRGGFRMHTQRREETAEHAVDVLFAGDGMLRVSVDGTAISVRYAREGADVLVSYRGETYRLGKRPPPDVDGREGGTAAAGNLTAPMPGTVVSVLVSEGESVSQGQTLLVLEAMKTEQAVHAPYAGVVRSVPYAPGASVAAGALLVEIEA